MKPTVKKRYLLLRALSIEDLCRKQSIIYDGAFLQKLQLLAINYFLKKAPSKFFDWVLNMPLLCLCLSESLKGTVIKQANAIVEQKLSSCSKI